MKLAEWRKSKGWSQEQAAFEISEFLEREIKQSQWSKWENGAMPQARSMNDIHLFTGGAVTLADMEATVDEKGGLKAKERIGR